MFFSEKQHPLLLSYASSLLDMLAKNLVIMFYLFLRLKLLFSWETRELQRHQRTLRLPGSLPWICHSLPLPPSIFVSHLVSPPLCLSVTPFSSGNSSPPCTQLYVLASQYLLLCLDLVRSLNVMLHAVFPYTYTSPAVNYMHK